MPRREDSKFHARAWVFRMTIWSAVKLIVLIRTQFSVVEHVHQKTKLFSGKCSLYYTCSIASKRRLQISRACVSVQDDRLKCCEADHAHQDTISVVEHVHQKTKLFSGKCSLYYTCSIASKGRLQISRACVSVQDDHLKCCEADHAHQDTIFCSWKCSLKNKIVEWKMLIRRKTVFSRLVS